ncbi:NAD(P)-dependent oxidoreductase [Piscinibacter sakaiensis]|uniref:NAD(P)-dependent oxidoreductase n=1 Tax=Piscinibacter sakaiensis TaxID=1547922 RepID=UPI003AB0E213
MSATHSSSVAVAGSIASIRKVGLLGLGIMGSAMSANLVRAGFEVRGYDPVPVAGQALSECGGQSLGDAESVIRDSEVLLLSLPGEAALKQTVMLIAAHGLAGQIVAETSTFSIEAKQVAHDLLAARGIVMLDCPLSGTGAQARTRDLAVYASGDSDAISRMSPVFDGFARVTYPIGVFGNGMRMKLMANLLVAIHNVSAAEALLMGSRMGIDMELAVKVLSDGAGGSRMLQVRGPMMVNQGWTDATMKVQTWQKDMSLIAAELAAANVPAPLFNACVPVYNAAMGMGHAKDDTAAVFDVLERMSAPARN